VVVLFSLLVHWQIEIPQIEAILYVLAAFSAAACLAGLLILLSGTVAMVSAETVTTQLTSGGLSATFST
jgi:hypothetical protein